LEKLAMSFYRISELLLLLPETKGFIAANTVFIWRIAVIQIKIEMTSL